MAKGEQDYTGGVFMPQRRLFAIPFFVFVKVISRRLQLHFFFVSKACVMKFHKI